ncbi:hypothetical protein [Larkinella soli]|uniref:hypothetical protein n=1 Tax=Larkinella soli TaxID=1770527 RepID=UPI000FFB6094|nr:hypothetical protein [Larkinella soli]
MRKLRLFSSAIALLIVMVTGCKDVTTEVAVRPTPANRAARISADQLDKLARLWASRPAGFEQRLQEAADRFAAQHPEYRGVVKRALGAAETACDANTPVNQWLSSEIADWRGTPIATYVLGLDMLNLPTYDALLFENSSANQTFGPNGEYTQRLTKTFKDLKRFWNIDTDGMVLAAMHGRMLSDPERLYRTYLDAYGLSPADAAYYTNFVLSVVQTFPQLRNGDHPIFTFNAFALEGFFFPPVGQIPNKIIMGDGFLQGLDAIGYGDVGPQAVLAHEFGHQIQFQLNLFGDEDTPEATRRTELMADAYSAYYLSHARGASMQWKRVQQFLQVFYNIGDCSFTSPDHHGTPAQRMAAARWAYELADNAQKQGHILTAQEFTARFEAALPGILAH